MSAPVQKLCSIAAFLAVAGIGYAPLTWTVWNAPTYAGATRPDFEFWLLLLIFFCGSLFFAVLIAAAVRRRVFRIAIAVAAAATATYCVYRVYEQPYGEDDAMFFIGFSLFAIGPFLGGIALRLVWPKIVDHSVRNI